MATVKQYALQLWDVQATTAAKLGSDIRSSGIQLRAALIAMDVTVAMILKLLVDGGTLTDSQLSSAATSVKNASFPPLDGDIVPSGDGSVPPPNLGS